MATSAGTALAVLVVTLLGCGFESEPKGYEPPADQPSGSLSRGDERKAENATVLMTSACDPLPEDDSRPRVRAARGRKGSDTPRAIATKDRHAVFTQPEFGYRGNTMIQALERIAHAYSNCRYAKELGEHAASLRKR